MSEGKPDYDGWQILSLRDSDRSMDSLLETLIDILGKMHERVRVLEQKTCETASITAELCKHLTTITDDLTSRVKSLEQGYDTNK